MSINYIHKLYEEYVNPGTYMSIKPLNESINMIKEKISNVSIDKMIPGDKLHVTLIHSKNTPFYDYSKNNIMHEAIVSGYDILGKGDWASIVLKLDSESLQKRHYELRSMGLNHSFPDYNCHMSIKYQPDKLDYFKLQNSRLMGEKIFFMEEYAAKAER